MNDSHQHEQWIYAAALGDQQAFAALYESTSARLMALAFSILNNRGLAEEALQEGFVQAWYRARDYRPERGRPGTWLAAIVRSRALDIYRREKSKPTHAGVTEELGEVPDPQAVAHPDSELQALMDCMEPLPEAQRNSILMTYYYGHSHGEIAQRLTQPLGTIKSWIRRGVQLIRECLEQ